jgi:hypothetical protein
MNELKIGDVIKNIFDENKSCMVYSLAYNRHYAKNFAYILQENGLYVIIFTPLPYGYYVESN